MERLNDGVVLPDLAVFIDVDPETGMERVSMRGEADRDYEELEMQRKVRQNYTSMYDRDEVVAVDGSGDPQEVHTNIAEKVEDSLDL